MRRPASPRPASRGRLGLRLAVGVLAVLSMAPTAGDVGGCGTTAKALDRGVYGEARKDLDCQRCEECGVANARCARACDPKSAPEIVLPVTCRPLYRDGEVCLRAIAAASCDTFETYVDEVAPAVPSECDFCKVPPEAPPPSFGDAGPGVGAVVGEGGT